MKNTLLTISLVLSTILASATPFITRWDLSLPGSGVNQISFHDTITGTVTYTWETVPVSSNSGSGTLTNGITTVTGLPTNAIIRLKIDSTNFNYFKVGSTDNQRLIDVEQWGTFKWTSMYYTFGNCYNLNISATDIPNLSKVTNTGYMFIECVSLNGPSNMNNWNTSQVTDMRYMFESATSFNQPIGNWNTSKVIDMAEMFRYAGKFNQPIGNWNTSKVINMAGLFAFDTSFNQPLGNWNLSQSTNIYKMLDSSGMDCHNYAATLHGWANHPATPHNLHFGAANIHYGTNVVADRNTLINTKHWIFYGDIADSTACNATGINSIPLMNNITLSPNPTHTTFQLSTKLPLNIQLYNTMGQMVTELSEVTAATEVNIAHLPSGLYIIKEAKTGLIIGKIMKE